MQTVHEPLQIAPGFTTTTTGHFHQELTLEARLLQRVDFTEALINSGTTLLIDIH